MKKAWRILLKYSGYFVIFAFVAFILSAEDNTISEILIGSAGVTLMFAAIDGVSWLYNHRKQHRKTESEEEQ